MVKYTVSKDETNASIKLEVPLEEFATFKANIERMNTFLAIAHPDHEFNQELNAGKRFLNSFVANINVADLPEGE